MPKRRTRTSFTSETSNRFKDKAREARWGSIKSRDEQAERMRLLNRTLSFHVKKVQTSKSKWKKRKNKVGLLKARAEREARERGGAIPREYEAFYWFMRKYKPQGWMFWACQCLLMCYDIDEALRNK